MKKNSLEKKIWVKPKIYILNYKKTEGGTPTPDGPEDGSYAPIS